MTRDVLTAQLEQRIAGKGTPSQVGTSYCGPAAFLYCVLEDRPDIYIAYAISLWMRGTFDFRTKSGNAHVASDTGTIKEMGTLVRRRIAKPGKAQISELDWMTMACLSASTRPFFVPGNAAHLDDVGSSITYPWVLKSWFAATGSRSKVDSMGLGAFKSGLFFFANLMRFWRDHWLVMQIDSSLIEGGTPNTFAQRHWVVVDPHKMPRVQIGGKGAPQPLWAILDEFWRVPSAQLDTAILGERMKDWPMDLRVVTWGAEDTKFRMNTLGDVASRFYGGYAFPRIG
ncbi:MAG: hypothetical protein EOP66_06195 [Sphingomonas sp.]|nr:MAG: hypothetical protein EOP66_06195 [Sphingomonas sp.]